jgi:hypothetical protein
MSHVRNPPICITTPHLSKSSVTHDIFYATSIKCFLCIFQCETLNYPGASPLSEPETFAVSKYMESFKFNLKMYLSIHSAGPSILWPFGFDFNVYVKNWKEHHLVGNLWAKAVFEATGTEFEVGNSADILYTSNGASDDHALAFANANLAYTIELPPSDFNWHDYPQDMAGDLTRGIFFGYRILGLYISEHYNYDS